MAGVVCPCLETECGYLAKLALTGVDRFRGRLSICVRGVTMSITRRPNAAEFRRQMIELVHAGPDTGGARNHCYRRRNSTHRARTATSTVRCLGLDSWQLPRNCGERGALCQTAMVRILDSRHLDRHRAAGSIRRTTLLPHRAAPRAAGRAMSARHRSRHNPIPRG
jgi:hypothetical protein